MANKTAYTIPTLCEVFFNFDMTEDTTVEYEEATKQFDTALNAACKDFREKDEIDSAATFRALEAQALGFAQGVAFALSLPRGSKV